jgi:hypothetical protein
LTSWGLKKGEVKKVCTKIDDTNEKEKNIFKNEFNADDVNDSTLQFFFSL